MVAHTSPSVMPGSVFTILEEASAFFRDAPIGYRPTPAAGVFDGLELRTDGWGIRPLHVDHASSSFFDEAARSGAVELDSAFLMGGLDTVWRPLAKLVAA